MDLFKVETVSLKTFSQQVCAFLIRFLMSILYAYPASF